MNRVDENPAVQYPVAEIDNLSRSFGKLVALNGVSFVVQPGLVYGLVGANGAGKTTLIKHLLGLLRAKQGSVRVFGLDPVKNPVAVLQKIGYLSEQRDLPDWMKIAELMKYTAAFHPNWDATYANELLQRFELDPSKKIKNLSKGMRAQVGLIAAVAHRPELLLLDEPSTGLDAVVRKDILNAIIRTVADDGRTAIFSSHLLDEVELMSDHVVMIDKGNLVLSGELDEIKSGHQLMSARFPDQTTQVPSLPGLLSAESQGNTWKIVCNGESERVLAGVDQLGGEVVSSRGATLQEIFIARVGRDRLETVEAD